MHRMLASQMQPREPPVLQLQTTAALNLAKQLSHSLTNGSAPEIIAKLIGELEQNPAAAAEQGVAPEEVCVDSLAPPLDSPLPRDMPAAVKWKYK